MSRPQNDRIPGIAAGDSLLSRGGFLAGKGSNSQTAAQPLENVGI